MLFTALLHNDNIYYIIPLTLLCFLTAEDFYFSARKNKLVLIFSKQQKQKFLLNELFEI
jgi:hypothetical protein